MLKIMLYLITTAVLTLLAVHFGRSQYAGYDASMMVNLAERLSLGQTSPADFFSPMPPLFASGARLCFLLFGSTWVSFCLLGGLFYAIGSAVVFRLSKNICDDTLTRGVSTFAIFSLTGAFYGFWWHTSITGLLAAITILAFIDLNSSRFSQVVFSISVGALFCSKPNLAIASPLLMLYTLTPVSMGGLGRKVVVVKLALGAVLTAFICIIFSGQSFFSYVKSLSDISAGRVKTLYNIPFTKLDPVADFARSASWTALSLCILALIVAAIYRYASKRSNDVDQKKKIIAAAIIIAPATLLALLTNGDFYHGTLPVLVVFIIPLVARESINGLGIVKPSTKLPIIITMLALCVFTLLGSVERDRVYGVGPGRFWEPRETSSLSENSFFKNSIIGGRLGLVLLETENALNKATVKKVFFGPRLEFGYAAFKQPSPKGMPLWFDTNSSWPRATEEYITSAFKEADFDLLIFNEADGYGMPRSLTEYINKEFEAKPGYSQIMVMARKR